jgi:hypothetical protein
MSAVPLRRPRVRAVPEARYHAFSKARVHYRALERTPVERASVFAMPAPQRAGGKCAVSRLCFSMGNVLPRNMDIMPLSRDIAAHSPEHSAGCHSLSMHVTYVR